MTSLRRTPLYEFNKRNAARFVDFGGWEMPVQYRSILEEHRVVRKAAGLFDVSHMGEVVVTGEEAAKFLDHLVPNDVSKLFPGRVLYTTMCQPDGGVIDDLLIYCRGANDFLLCINASNIAKDVAWISTQAAAFKCHVEDQSDAFGLLALQGPKSREILETLFGESIAALPYYHCETRTLLGAKILLARTGYTGEDGYEIFCPSAEAERLAEKILETGKPLGLELCGLGARDSLRLEAGYPLYGHELSATISPLEAGLGWTVKLEKASDFIGKAALLAQKKSGVKRQVVFFRTGDRRIVRAGTPVRSRDAVVGEVLSGTLSPQLNESIGSAMVPFGAENLSVDVRGEALSLKPQKPPFVPLPQKN